jgi:mannan endo-1,4-beta-mannosidase
MIFEAERQWKAGAVVNLMWHASPPNQGSACDWEGGILSRLSDEEWDDLLSDGGLLHRVWENRMDSLLPYLNYLQDRGVAVLWRPFHEMNQEKFWWGGRPGPRGSAGLFRWMHQYFSREKGLRNLVWTWDVQDLRRDWDGYAPGPDFYDLMALDVYGKGFSDSWYKDMLKASGGKPFGLGEVAKMPHPDVLARQSRYCLVMGWADLVFSANTEAELAGFFRHPRILSREEMPGWQGNVAGWKDGSAERAA